MKFCPSPLISTTPAPRVRAKSCKTGVDTNQIFATHLSEQSAALAVVKCGAADNRRGQHGPPAGPTPDGLRASPASHCAASYGGMVAMAHAARYPPSVSHLVLIVTAAHAGFNTRARAIVAERGTSERLVQAIRAFLSD